MEVLLVIIGAVLGFFGIRVLNKNKLEKTHDAVKTLEGQKLEIKKREDIKSVPKLDKKEVVDYWDKELK
jgi:uncharacterized membrane protein (DUF106 family)